MRQFMPALIQVDGDQREPSDPPSTPTSARLLSPPPLYFRHWIHPILSVGPLTSHPLEPQGSQTCLQLSKIVLTTPRISHVFYMFIKTSSIHQVNGTFFFLFVFFLHRIGDSKRSNCSQVLPSRVRDCITCDRHPRHNYGRGYS